jgi:ubiquitin-like protein ATG12
MDSGSFPSDGSRRDSPQPAVPSPARVQRNKAAGRRDSAADTTRAAAAGNAATPIPDEDHGVDIPLTMSASVVLTGLPQDAHRALADAEAVDVGKGAFPLGHINSTHFSSFRRVHSYVDK